MNTFQRTRKVVTLDQAEANGYLTISDLRQLIVVESAVKHKVRGLCAYVIDVYNAGRE